MPEQLSTIQKIHDEVKFLLCLESIVEIHDEGVFDFLEDFSLSLMLH
jgi:hypothetical protein